MIQPISISSHSHEPQLRTVAPLPPEPTVACTTATAPVIRLLASDDTKGIQQLYGIILPRYGFEVMTVPGGDGDATLELCYSYRPDLLISDVNKPGLSGHAICKALRAEPELADTPVLMITAMDSWLERQRGHTITADDYLVKPFSLEALVYRIIALTGATRSELEHMALRTHNEPGLDYLHPVTGLPGPQALTCVLPRMTGTPGRAAALLRIDGFERLVRIYGRSRADDLLAHLVTALRMVSAAYGEEQLFLAHPGYDWRIALVGNAVAVQESVALVRHRFSRILRRFLPYEALERRAIFYRDRRGLIRTAPLPLLAAPTIAASTRLTLADFWRIG